MIAMAHAAAARVLGYELAGIASRTPARAEQLAATFGTVALTYEQLPAGADVVVVATPPQCHAADAVRMLQAGASVLLEKPLCRTLDEADAIVVAAAASGGRLLYAENLAYAPIVQRLVALAPKVGTPAHLEVRSLQGLPTWGAFTTDEWGGGALFDLGVHPLAVAMLLANSAGLGRATGVSALLRGGDGHGSDEHAEVTLHFRSGFTASVVSSWQFGPDPQWDAQLAGDAGVVRAELLPEQRLAWNGDDVALPTPTTNPAVLEQLGYAAQLKALVDDGARGIEPVMSAAFGREVLQVVLAAYSSAGLGGEQVSLPFTGQRDRTPLQLWRGA
jgi:myo-inositol 2-dehydrogenase / D-chiro-inositol 1-dehydrogenase